jgi:prepilin-type N-terminal cleavage/methylation domain-containing protein
MSMLQKRTYKSGFTLVELGVVILVIGILASITIVGYGQWQRQIAKSAVESDLNGAASAMESARNFNESGYPSTIPSTFKSSSTVDLAYSWGNQKEFCLTATSTRVTTVIMYIRSSESKAPQDGSCPTYTPPPTSAPTLASNSVLANAASLSWTAVTNSTSYETQMRPEGGTWSTSRVRTSTTDSYTLPTAGQSYEFRVRAVNAGGSSDWSNSISRVYVPTPTISGISGEYCTSAVTMSTAYGTLTFAIAPNSVASQYLIQGQDGYSPRTVVNNSGISGTRSEGGYSSRWAYESGGSGVFTVQGIGPNGERSSTAYWNSRTYVAYDC